MHRIIESSYVYLALFSIHQRLKAHTQERMFNIVVEKDEDGYYVGSVVELPGCHTQAKTLDVLNKRVKVAIEAYLQVAEPEQGTEFVGVRQLKMKLPA